MHHHVAVHHAAPVGVLGQGGWQKGAEEEEGPRSSGIPPHPPSRMKSRVLLSGLAGFDLRWEFFLRVRGKSKEIPRSVKSCVHNVGPKMGGKANAQEESRVFV